MSRRSVICRVMITLMIAISAFSSFDAYVAADDQSSIYLPVNLSDKNGNIPEGTAITVRISAAEGMPMPEETEIIATSQGTYRFGPIMFDEPGNYEYTVNEIAYDNNLVYDRTVYTVEVVVIYNDRNKLASCYVTYRNGSSDKVDGIAFVNEYIGEEKPDDSTQTDVPQSQPTSNPSSNIPHDSNLPNTGTMAAFGISLLFITMLLMTILTRWRKNGKKEQK